MMDVYQVVVLGCLAVLLGFMLLVPYLALLSYRYFAAHRAIGSSLPALKWSSVLTVIGCEAGCALLLLWALEEAVPGVGIRSVSISPHATAWMRTVDVALFFLMLVALCLSIVVDQIGKRRRG